ncbi:MAG: DinB family protein [Bryobacteraceae bacterium]
MSELTDLLERFRRGPEMVAVATTGVAGSEMDFVTAPGKWSIRQIVAHLADDEIVAATRFRRVIAEERPALESFDQDAWAANLDYARRKPSQSLETLRRIRAENHDLLKELPESAFEREGVHSERGPMTLADLLRMYTAHDEAHVLQLRANRAAFKQFKAQQAAHT